MRPIAEQWIAWALVRGQMVHWVDGACRVDPSLDSFRFSRRSAGMLKPVFRVSISVADLHCTNWINNSNAFRMN